ncbi:hypothetical protein [Chitinophaga sp. RAB17]|uniref:hypothetical protein n=1 Tax=Chitinophaga sp. RAB17 TaxID=3233049 RepID=UPI003F92B80A
MKLRLPATQKTGCADNAVIIGLGNRNPNSHEPEKGNKQSVFNGLAQVIIQSKEGGSREIVITATSPNLKAAAATISLESVLVQNTGY